ncbi:MAG TPA: hypothetical protein VEA99_06125 [Gemmatimonadaceae bacterium]|nr:hypothetical protein [Gemmatimonadaceae bacterium]
MLVPIAVFLVLTLAGGAGGVMLRLRLAPPAHAAAPHAGGDSAHARDSAHAVDAAHADGSTRVTDSTAAHDSTRSDGAPARGTAIARAVDGAAHAPAAAPATPSESRPAAPRPPLIAALPVPTRAATADSAAHSAQQRLGRVLSSMPPKDAARVIEKLADAEAVSALGYLKEKQAALILANLPAERAAAMVRAGLRVARGAP